ncbi:MAG: GSCFA domain-containing protein [Dysgonamonadaceae bacterium]|jgi:hypothetical protein|nr:GSCFA domain-containing protein [Dysgonamonadaceae bacterium]
MKFRTEITLPAAGFTISHPDQVMTTGSCFAENISERMLQGGFTVDVNPLGIVYNPASVAGSLQDLIRRRTYTEADLFLHEGVYHSFSHHSRFSGADSRAVLEKINASIAHSSAFLRKANLLIITFGTAHVYRRVSTGQVVSNCHKRPAREFEEQRLTVEQITEQWNGLIRDLQALNSGLKILFTVSPIRHWKDGAHANQLSKAILLLAVNELVQSNAQCYYFPAYEIVLDDLRDYRFYAADLVHPNSQAVDYIWEKFGEVYFDKCTRELVMEYEKRHKQMCHVKRLGHQPAEGK